MSSRLLLWRGSFRPTGELGPGEQSQMNYRIGADVHNVITGAKEYLESGDWKGSFVIRRKFSSMRSTSASGGLVRTSETEVVRVFCGMSGPS